MSDIYHENVDGHWYVHALPNGMLEIHNIKKQAPIAAVSFVRAENTGRMLQAICDAHNATAGDIE